MIKPTQVADVAEVAAAGQQCAQYPAMFQPHRLKAATSTLSFRSFFLLQYRVQPLSLVKSSSPFIRRR
jgi:hypothetical protein